MLRNLRNLSNAYNTAAAINKNCSTLAGVKENFNKKYFYGNSSFFQNWANYSSKINSFEDGKDKFKDSKPTNNTPKINVSYGRSNQNSTKPNKIICEPGQKIEIKADSGNKLDGQKKPAIKAGEAKKPDVKAVGFKKPEIIYDSVKKPDVNAEGVKKPDVNAEGVKKPEIISTTTNKEIKAPSRKKPEVISEPVKKIVENTPYKFIKSHNDYNKEFDPTSKPSNKRRVSICKKLTPEEKKKLENPNVAENSLNKPTTVRYNANITELPEDERLDKNFNPFIKKP